MKEIKINNCMVRTKEFLNKEAIETILFYCIDPRNTYKNEIFTIILSGKFYKVIDSFNSPIGAIMHYKDLESKIFMKSVL